MSEFACKLAGAVALAVLLVSQLDYGGSREPTIYVGIQVINTVAKEVPPDLADSAFDTAATRARFHALIDAVAAALSGRRDGGYDGVVGPLHAQMATLNTRSDAIMLTYYPIGANSRSTRRPSRAPPSRRCSPQRGANPWSFRSSAIPHRHSSGRAMRSRPSSSPTRSSSGR